MNHIWDEDWFIPAAIGISASVGGFVAGMVVGLRVGYQARVNEEEETERNFEVVTIVEEDQLEFEFEAKEDDIRLLDNFERISDPEFRAEVAESRDRVVERDRIQAEKDPNPRNDPRDITVEREPVMVHIDDVIEVVTDTNVFDTEFDHWDYEEEVPSRTADEPYIIHRDEFWAEELAYDQSTLTYYAEDDILIDDKNKPIYGYESITGKLIFGHGSGDTNVVYVRNDKRSAEYEILRFEGAYSREVLGIELEEDSERSDLKHSIKKFRPRDE